jgi:hypothetical protein
VAETRTAEPGKNWEWNVETPVANFPGPNGMKRKFQLSSQFRHACSSPVSGGETAPLPGYSSHIAKGTMAGRGERGRQDFEEYRTRLMWAYNVELPGAYLDRGSFYYVVDDALHLPSGASRAVGSTTSIYEVVRS